MSQYELYVNDNGTPVALSTGGGTSPAIDARVTALETECAAIPTIQTTADAAQTAAATANALASAALPLSGGTMTGTILSSIANILSSDGTINGLAFRGGTSDTDGAILRLMGVDSVDNPGGFQLAIIGTDGGRHWLQAKTDGTLTWDNHPLNAYTKTISSAAPSGGTDGDVWFQYV